MKKVMFILLSMLILFTLTACDEDFTLPSGVTLPTDITTTDDTTIDLPTTEEITTEETTDLPTTDDATTEEPTTEIREITISFDSQGGSSIDNLGVLENTNNDDLNLPIPAKEGFTFDDWYTSTAYDQVFVFNDELANTVTVYAKWTPNQYTITFVENDGTVVSDITEDYLSDVSEPDDPTREGYTFDGWFSDDGLTTAYVFTTMPLNGLTLYAKWSINQYTINFEENGGSDVVDITDDYLTTLIKPNDPTKEGYTFDGWFSDNALSTAYVFTTMPAEDTVLYAKWTPNQYTLSYYETGDLVIRDVFNTGYTTFLITEDNQILASGLTYLDVNEKWNEFKAINQYFSLNNGEVIEYFSGSPTHFFAMTSDHRVLAWGQNSYGKLGIGNTTKQYTPTDITDNFDLAPDEIITHIDGSYDLSYAITSTGRVFLWGYNGQGAIGDGTKDNHLTPYDLTPRLNLLADEKVVDVSVGNVHTLILTNHDRVFSFGFGFHGQLGLNYQPYNVLIPTLVNSHFSLLTDDTIVDVKTTTYGSFILTEKGQLFVFGLDQYGNFGIERTTSFLSPTEISSQLALDANDKIIAIETNVYNTYLYTQLGKIYAFGSNTNNILFGGPDILKFSLPTELTESIGYDIEKAFFNTSSTMILTKNNQLLAIGKNDSGEFGLGDYNIYTELQLIDIPGSEAILLQENQINYNELVNLYQPTQEGYQFMGWFTDQALTNEFSLTEMPAEDVSLYAKWQINQYTISFEGNGGSQLDDITLDYLSNIIKPSEDPVKLGYVFDGWYLDESFTNQYGFDSMITEDLTLYAKWVALAASITFDIDDIVIENIEGYTGDTISLPTPTTDGKTFAGWFIDSDFSTEVNWTSLPAGTTTLYGKWDFNSYTITYESNGGSIIEIETYYYEDPLVKPDSPTKTDYVFSGWYLDSAFVYEFSFTTMPAKNITLYAKWADASNPYLIINQINQPDGTLVTVQGVVYDFFDTTQTGIFIYDESGQVIIDATDLTLTIGDKIEVQGTLNRYDGIPYIHMVTQITILSSDNDLPTPIPYDLANIGDLTNTDLFKVYESQGLIMPGLLSEDLTVFDPNTLNYLLINSETYSDIQALELASHITDQISITYTIVSNNGLYQISIIDYTITPIPLETKATILQTMIETHNDLNFLPGDKLPINQLNMLGMGSLTVSVPTDYETYYDVTDNMFLETDEEVTIPMTVTYTINQTSTTFVINVNLKPMLISTIEQVINDVTLSYHTIEVMVVAKNEIDMILKDDTGYLYAVNMPYVQIGDLVQFIVRNDRDYPMTYLDFTDGDIILHRIVSKENELNLTPTQLTNAEFLALNPLDMGIYGQYVELRGFINDSHSEDHFGYYLTNDDYSIEIMIMSHSGVEKIMEYIGLEAYIRGFLYRDHNGDMKLFYEGIRQDIRIPDYTDQERVDVLVQIFNYHFDGETYDAFDYLPLFPYHPVLGGEVAWTFSDANFEYFDFENQQFLYSETDQPFTLNITISSGNVSETIVYSSQLNKMVLTPFLEVKNMNSTYEDVFIQGVIIYRAYDIAYIKNNLGEILMLKTTDIDAITGDEIILYASTRMQNGYWRYIYLDNVEVLEILSRDNDTTMVANNVSLEDIDDNNVAYDTSFNQYVEVTGFIKYIESSNMIYIHDTHNLIVLDFATLATELHFLEYIGEYVTIRGYVYSEKYESGYGVNNGRYWKIFVTGMPGDIEPVVMTNQEKFDFLENHIRKYYETTIYGDDLLSFVTADYYFDDVDITYTILNDPDGIGTWTSEYFISILATEGQSTITFQVDLYIDEFSSHTLTFDIVSRPEETLDITPIDQLIIDGMTIEYVQGIVISVSRIDDDQYTLLMQDDTGLIFVDITRSQFTQFSDLYNGYLIELIAYGTVNHQQGKVVMTADGLINAYTSPTMTYSFEEMTIDQLLGLDLDDPTIYGKSIEVEGRIEVVWGDLGREYYLVTDDAYIRLLVRDFSYSQLYAYRNLDVIVRGFIYGLDENAIISLMYFDKTYGSTPSIEIGQYTDAEVIELVKNSILENGADDFMRIYMPNDYISYPNPNGVIVDHFGVSVDFNIVEGLDYTEDLGNYLKPGIAPEDFEILIECTLQYNGITETFTFKFYVNGFTVKTIDDLFDTTPGTPEIALEATVIYSSWNIHYLLIDGEVYLLNQVLYSWVSPGDIVIIVGQKSIIDNIPDYTYNIVLIETQTNEPLIMTPLAITIEELYTNDYQINPLQRDAHILTGYLEYDRFADLYTLTDGDYMVYIRPLSDWGYREIMDSFLGEYIDIQVLLPMEMYRDEFMIADAYNLTDGISVIDYSKEDEVALIKSRIEQSSSINAYSGDYIDDYLISEYTNHPYIEITYSMVDPLDEAYFDIDNNLIGYVNTITTFDILATITYDNPITLETYFETTTITFNIHPRTLSTVKDVLYGITDEIYLVEGVIVAIGETNNGMKYMIIDDGMDLINVYLNDYETQTFDGENISLALYDDVRIISQRGYSDPTFFIPQMYTPRTIEVISSGNVITHTANEITIDETFTMDYTDINSFYQYVTISGTVNEVFGGFSIESSSEFFNYDHETPAYKYLDIENDLEPATVLELQNLVGETIEITGFLFGYHSQSSYGVWRIIMISYQEVVE